MITNDDRTITVKLPKTIILQVINGEVCLMGTRSQFKSAMLALPSGTSRSSGRSLGVIEVNSDKFPRGKRGHASRLSTQQHRAICLRREQGESAVSVAKDYGICVGYVYQIVKKYSGKL